MPDETLWVKMDKDHLGATVTKILVAGTVAEYPTAPDGGSEPAMYFHWQFYAYLQEFPTQCVALDMTPGGLDGNAGILMVSTKNALRAPDEDRNLLVREVAILGSSRMTVQGLVDLVTYKGLTHYRFNDEGMGCRWWCEAAMQVLENEGYVENGTVVDLDRWWFATAAVDQRVPSTKIKGSFY